MREVTYCLPNVWQILMLTRNFTVANVFQLLCNLTGILILVRHTEVRDTLVNSELEKSGNYAE